MNVTKTNIDELNAVISIELKIDDYLVSTEKALANYRNKVEIKGFRKGTVPVGMVKKMYGNAIMLEEINKQLSSAMSSYLTNEKLDMLGRPIAKPQNEIKFDINNPTDLIFEYEVGLSPNFSIDILNTKTKIDKEIVVMDDATLDKELEKLCKRNGNVLTPEDSTVEENDVLTFNLDELDGKTVKENGIQYISVFETNMIIDKKQLDKIYKLKVGDSFTLKPFDAFDDTKEEIAKFHLGLKNGIPDGMSDSFKATLTKISRVEKAALNQELFDKVYGPAMVNSLEEFKERVRKELTTFAEKNIENKFKDTLYNTLMEKIDIQFPVAFLKKFIKSSNEKPISDADLEKEYPNFEKGLKWQLISNKIAKDNDLKIELENVKKFSMDALREQLKMYNPTGNDIADAELEVFNNSMMSKEEHVKKSYSGAMEQKLFTFIESKVTVKEKQVNFDEFFKQNKN